MKKGWSAKQVKAIELLSTGELTDVQVCQAIPIDVKSLWRWRQLPGFMEDVIIRARRNLKQSMPEIYKTLAASSKNGNHNHIKIYLDHLEKLEQIKASRANITFTWLPPTLTDEG